MKKIKGKWDGILGVIKRTKDLDVDRILIVPLEEWNPSVLSRERKRLFMTIRKRNIRSEDELARILKRKRPNVVKDLKLLEHYGLIKRERVGKRVVPKIAKTEIIIH